MIFYFLIIIFIAITFYFRKKNFWGIKEKFEKLTLKHFFVFLISWIAIGFLTRLDNNLDWGCIIQSAPIFRLDNIVFSSISMIIIFLSWRVKQRSIKLLFILVEVFYFMTKFLFVKGGYEVGFGASPNDFVVLYDYLSILVRILIIVKLINKQFRLYIPEIVAIILISIKVFFPHYTEYFKQKFNSIESNMTVEKLSGKWSGEIYYNRTIADTIDATSVDSKNILLVDILASNDTVLVLKKDTVFYERIILEIDSINFNFESSVLNENLFIRMQSKYYGLFYRQIDSVGCADMYVRKLSKDSIYLDVGSSGSTYKLKLQKNNAY